MGVESFKKELSEHESDLIVRSSIFAGETFAMSNLKYTQLRDAVAKKFGIDPLHIYMVGSAKLGFSIKPKRRYGEFNDESDIDLAIISPELFQKVWQTAYLYTKTGVFWHSKAAFFSYLSEGWIRPDKFPRTEFDPFFGEWWEFFLGLSQSREFSDYPIRAGIYQSRFFLEEYQKICVEQCKQELIR